MSDRRNDSLQSAASILTSFSSEHSAELYEGVIKPATESIEKSDTSLQDLVDAAEKIIKEKFTPDPRSTYAYTKGRKKTSVQLDQIMIAMLACAEECGGEKGKRYVASAVIACSQEEDVVGALEALGTTWLTHFLFVFKTGRGHSSQPRDEPSEVLVRDGYKCVLTGSQHITHPNIDANILVVDLEVAHILRRAIGEFNPDHKSKSFKSAATTFDILVNFTHLPVETLEDLRGQLDDASNGMALQHDAHYGFDNFRWCLKRTETEHVYELKIFNDVGILKKPANNRVSFEDHSNQFPLDYTDKERSPVKLPDPCFIAIHAAIAGILHMSGAGKFFDELLDDYRDDEGKIPAVRSWSELEALMGEQLMREAIIQGFQSVDVY
ncbi:hypothetical protein D9613_007421 [Agrocybe pediades]|uniref:HNH nuclease domain-containing protein n=1 Tax=Agrocybe pediades TaxID=84607 RepID=A0A8H4VKQ3_9AGAR|nr:hypothetical protein D9613_007421 [Agrocybe pediades]